MKNVILSFSSALIVAFGSLAQITPIIQPSPRKVQVAILFDTSNSMDGLIDQAKIRIWSIINELSALRFQGQMPSIEIALYDYGNSSLTMDNNYIRLQTGLTKDLDLISEIITSAESPALKAMQRAGSSKARRTMLIPAV